MDKTTAKIYLEHVSFVYSPGTPFEQKALDDVTLGIRGGCVTGIIGHTGSGKSTMMQLLNGLAKPTSGKVYLDGYNINCRPEEMYDEWMGLPEYEGLSVRKKKKKIAERVRRRLDRLCFRVGLVMQYPEYQLFEDTVEKDIAFGPRNKGKDEEEVARRVLEAADFVGLDRDLLQKSPFDLSGGQKRRVALAGVIAMHPDVLVLDEPAAGLDPRGKSSVFNSIREYQRKTGSTVLIVSHSMEDMAMYCDDVVILSEARVLRQGSCKEVFADAKELTSTGLNIPQITLLMQKLRDRGVPAPESVYTVDDAVEALRALLDGKEAAE